VRDGQEELIDVAIISRPFAGDHDHFDPDLIAIFESRSSTFFRAYRPDGRAAYQAAAQEKETRDESM
jgi:hypothetical protein